MSISLLPANESNFLKELDKSFGERIESLDISGITIDPMKAKKEILPFLAYMFDVDIGGLEESEQRLLIKNAIEIHLHKGTVWAVKKALEAVFERSELLEWFADEKNDEPYSFKVKVFVNPANRYDLQKIKKAKELIAKAKNVRSFLKSFLLEIPEAKEDIFIKTGAALYNFSIKEILQKDVKLFFTEKAAATLRGFNFSVKIKKSINSPFIARGGGVFKFVIGGEMNKNIAGKIYARGGAIWQL